MRYATVCTGINAPTVAWELLEWEEMWCSEIDKFCNAVLAYHFPYVANLGDMTEIHKHEKFGQPVDLICGGTPCQSFSVAGLRKGLADPRGNLTLAFLGVLERARPAWMVWENVPGVFSSWCDEAPGRLEYPTQCSRSRGAVEAWQTHAFNTFLLGLQEIGYGVAWRVFDAQYFDLAQRRERVFVVGYLGDPAPARAVLLERGSLQGHPAPSREEREEVAVAAPGSAGVRRGHDKQDQGGMIADVTAPLCGQQHGVAIAFKAKDDPISDDEISPALQAQPSGFLSAVVCAQVAPPVTASGPPFSRTGNERTESEALVAEFPAGQGAKAGGIAYEEEVAPTLKSAPSGTQLAPAVQIGMKVRRLTPMECERLQGFPENYTRVPNYRSRVAKCEVEEMAAYHGMPVEEMRELGVTPDSQRYKALGNSMPVPVLRWIGERIEQVQEVLADGFNMRMRLRAGDCQQDDSA